MEELTAVQENDVEIDLLELFHVLMSKILVLIICFAVGGCLAFGGTKLLITPKYTASSMIYILTKTTSVTSLADIQMGAQLTTDFEILAKSRPVLEQVITDLNLDCTYEELCGYITVTNKSNTRILQMSVEHKDPQMAMDIANSVAKATAERVAYVMTTDEPKIVEDATLPTTPSSPHVAKNSAIGALLGLILAAGVVIVQYLLDDTIKNSEDVRKYLDLNTLASVPSEKKRKK